MNEVNGDEVIVVRHARPDDAAVAAELLAELGYPVSIDQVVERLARGTAAADNAVLVVEAGGRTVGLASFHRIPLFHADGFLGRITSFVVARTHRQRGVGRRLIAAVEEFAWAQGCIRLEVTSGDHRPEAHIFYERVGYASDCRRFIKKRTTIGRLASDGATTPAPVISRCIVSVGSCDRFP